MNLNQRWAMLTAALILAACDGNTGTANRTGVAVQTTLTGQVLDEDGTALSGHSVVISDRDGQEILSTQADAEGHFNVKIPADTAYPLVLTASLTTGTNPLKAVVVQENTTEQDISPMTTMVVDTALSLGGLTEANLAKAAVAAISQRKKSGGTGSSTGFKGDPTKQYGGWH